MLTVQVQGARTGGRLQQGARDARNICQLTAVAAAVAQWQKSVL